MEEVLNPVQEEAVPEEAVNETAEVVDIQFRPGQKIYFFDPDGMQFEVGDHVVMDTARGAEFGICAGGNHIIPARDVVAPLRKILRKATAQDERINAENRAREKRAFEICLQKIENHGLDMQLVSAECAFDGSKILFYFTADERVDFRELVKDLASVFHTRIELRQIGVRDKAKMVGGLGICGRPFCCASFLDDFQPVSIKMAKTQNLSLNPTKISGTCGRLMCCLKYEQDTYEKLIRTSPKVDSFVDTPEGRGIVIESEILRQRVKVQMEDNPETVAYFANEDIAVLRSGKAKKTDPPIPADLAPISGSGKRPRKPKEETAAPMLDPIRFRYSTEAIVEERQPAEVPEEEKNLRQRRRRPNRPEAPEAQEPEAAENQEQPARPAKPHRERRDRREEKPEGEKPERPERPERPRRERRPERNEGEPAEKPAENAEQTEKTEQKPERPERRERRPRGERPNRSERPERAERPEKAENPEGDEQQLDKPERADRPPRPNHNNRRGPRPQRNQQEGTDAPQDGQPAQSAEGEKPHRRNNFYRHRKPKAPQE